MRTIMVDYEGVPKSKYTCIIPGKRVGKVTAKEILRQGISKEIIEQKYNELEKYLDKIHWNDIVYSRQSEEKGCLITRTYNKYGLLEVEMRARNAVTITRYTIKEDIEYSRLKVLKFLMEDDERTEFMNY